MPARHQALPAMRRLTPQLGAAAFAVVLQCPPLWPLPQTMPVAVAAAAGAAAVLWRLLPEGVFVGTVVGAAHRTTPV